MNSPAGYIAIERRFRTLKELDNKKHVAELSYLSDLGKNATTIGWDDLLRQRVTVVLGEPGSGKSYELRHQCAALREKKQFAFFVELERLINSDLESTLETNDKSLLLKWKAGKGRAYFLLDSVDESKLAKRTDFHKALNRLCNFLDQQLLARATLILSSRISEWQPQLDLAEVAHRLRLPSSPSSNGSEPRTEREEPSVVVMLPLSRKDVENFAHEMIGTNSAQFVAALHSSGAWEFARRPADVFSLIEYWKKDKKLGTLREIIEHDVTVKLREPQQSSHKETMPPRMVREGAACLAAAVVLCKQQQFKIPDDTNVAEHAISADKCLPSDWQAKQVSELLSRPIFDSATYGHIRFHHRRLSEFLTAEWLDGHMADGCPYDRIESLFFAEVNGGRILRQSLAPIVAWLCLGDRPQNERIRKAVLESAPEVHFEFGDASSLPSLYVAAVIERWVDQHRQRKRVWIESTPESLRRLANPASASVINKIIELRDVPSDVRYELMQIIRFGKIRESIDPLIHIIGSAAESERIKQTAMATIRDAATKEQKVEAWQVIRSLEQMSAHFGIYACETLFPLISAADCADILKKTVSDGNDGIFVYQIEHLIDNEFSPADAVEFLATISSVSEPGNDPSLLPEVGGESKLGRWRIAVLPALLSKAFSADNLDEETLPLLCKMFRRVNRHHTVGERYSEHTATLNHASVAHPAFRRLFVTMSVERWRSENAKDIPHSYDLFGFTSLFQFVPADLDWLVELLSSRLEQEDKCIYFWICSSVAANKASSTQAKKRFRQLVQSDHDLRALRARQRHVWTIVARLIPDQFARRNIWLKIRSQILSVFEGMHQNWALYTHRRALANGSSVQVLGAICMEIRADPSSEIPDWTKAQKKFGRGTALAAKRGCQIAWRQYRPCLPHEEENPKECRFRVATGLTGINTLISEQPSIIEKLCDDDLELITRYGVNALNGFPDWMEALANYRPSVVSQVLSKCIAGEWQYSADRTPAYDVIAKLAARPTPLSFLALKQILARFEDGIPTNDAVMKHSLAICFQYPEASSSTMVRVAAIEANTLPIDSERFVMWICALLQFDGKAGIDILNSRLAQEARADDTMLRVCANLGDRNFSLHLLSPSFKTPHILASLIPLVYKHIRPADDHNRIGKGQFQSDMRDSASEFRDSLLAVLLESEDTHATVVLRSLLDDVPSGLQQDWLRHLLKQRLERENDLAGWSEADVRAFASKYKVEAVTQPGMPNGDVDFVISDRVDSGLHGVVWKARQLSLDRNVAVKLFKPEFVNAFNAKLQAQLLAKLQHQNIVSVITFAPVSIPHFGCIQHGIVMEWLDGSRLDKLLNERALGPEQAAKLCAQFIGAMKYMHSQSVCHGDIKVSNIMVCRDEVKVIDLTDDAGDIRNKETSRTDKERADLIDTANMVTHIFQRLGFVDSAFYLNVKAAESFDQIDSALRAVSQTDGRGDYRAVTIPGLTETDSEVLGAIGDQLLRLSHNKDLLSTRELGSLMDRKGIGENTFKDALESLELEGCFDEAGARYNDCIQLSTAGFELFLRHNYPKYNDVVLRIRDAIVEHDQLNDRSIAEFCSLPRPLVLHVLEWFKDNECCELDQSNAGSDIVQVTVKLRRLR